MAKQIGIDLGTANVLVFMRGRGIVINEPSVVAISAKDGKVKAVGLEARNMLGREPRETIEVVRPMRDGVIADYVVTQEMLRYFINKSCGRFSLVRPEVMICVPAGVTGVERRAVRDAALNAGARRAYLISEPSPYYESFPRLRSKEPNLEAYRRLDVEVFKAEDGHTLHAGRVIDLLPWAFTSACRRGGYVLRGNCRLANYLLPEMVLEEEAGSELYAASQLHKDRQVIEANTQALAAELWESVGPGDESEAECLATARTQARRERRAEHLERFREFGREDASDVHQSLYSDWAQIAQALVEGAPLGLPDELLVRFLENEYGLDEFAERIGLSMGGTFVGDALATLADRVVYELHNFHHDGTAELLAARRNDDQDTFLRERGEALDHGDKWLETLGACRRNQADSPSAFAYRASTLGGRLTTRGSQPAVQRQEYLMAADEIMAAVAYELESRGFAVCGVAGDEFVVESRCGDRSTSEAIARAACRAARRLIGNGCGLKVVVEAVGRW